MLYLIFCFLSELFYWLECSLKLISICPHFGWLPYTLLLQCILYHLHSFFSASFYITPHIIFLHKRMYSINSASYQLHLRLRWYSQRNLRLAENREKKYAYKNRNTIIISCNIYIWAFIMFYWLCPQRSRLPIQYLQVLT